MAFGHGRPQVTLGDPAHMLRSPTTLGRQRIAFEGAARWVLQIYICLMGWGSLVPTHAQENVGGAVECELRIVWGGGVPRIFDGTLAVDSGTIHLVRNLGLQADSIGKQRNERPNVLSILPGGPTSFGGVDIRVRGQLATKLTIRFEDPYSAQTTEQQVTLAELLQGNWLKPLDDHGGQVAIERQQHDRLRLHSERRQPIFDSGELWPVEVTGHRTGLAAGQYTLRWAIFQGSELQGEPRQQTVSVNAQGSFEAASQELSVPVWEGAYHLEISIHRRNFLNSFVSTGPLLTRRLDFIVLEREQTPSRPLNWQPLATIDPLRASKPGSLAWLSWLDMRNPLGLPNTATRALPASLNVVDRLQPYNPLAGSMNQPLSHGGLGERGLTVQDPDSQSSRVHSVLTLEPAAWIALPVQGLQRNVPHRLRLRVPTDQPGELTVSVQQKNVAGDYSSLSLDSGITIGPQQVRPGGQAAQPEVIFWPRTDQIFILLVNTGKRETATVIDVHLETAALDDSPLDAPLDDLPSSSSNASPPQAMRMVGINLDKPLLADVVGASRELDSATGRGLESWSTWQQAATRIGQLMQISQANTLLLKAFSEGGAVFPSEYLQPTVRFDNGTFFSDGRSPDIKDAVELLLRHFDRADLHLVIALDLESALPALARFEDADASIVQQPLVSVGESRRESPHYNPLHPRVQEALIAALRDLVQRYGHHPSFAGIALQLTPRSHVVFAGDRWGYDERSLNEFQKFAQVKLPPREKWEAVFQGPARLSFLQWRAQELGAFYARLGEIIENSHPRAKLYLNPVRLWDTFPDSQDFCQPDAIIRNPREYLLAFGISLETLAQTPQVELMRGSIEKVSRSVDSRDWLLRESAEVEFMPPQSDNLNAALVLHPPSRHELVAAAEFDGTAERWLYPSMFQPGEYARKRLIEQLYHSDPQLLVEGGWFPLGSQDTATQTLYRGLRELPPVPLKPFRPTGVREQTNIVARSAIYEGKTYVQIINNASWDENVRISSQAGTSDTQPRVLGGKTVALTNTASANAAGSPAGWSLVVPAYDMVAFEIDNEWKLSDLRHRADETATQRIAAQLQILESLVSQSADPTQQKILANVAGDFENWNRDGQPVGWSVSTLPSVSIGKSVDLPHKGKASLLIENRSRSDVSAWIQSRGFEPPASGRISLQAWLRGPAVSEPLRVRLSIIGRTKNGQRFERSLELGDASQHGMALPIDWGRKPATLHAGDLPTEELVEVTASIELIGPGRLWIDDVQVFESMLQPEERNYLRGQLLVAKQKLAEGNLYPAEQLLHSHWGSYLLRYGLQDAVNPRPPTLPATATTSEPGPRSTWSETPSVFKQFRESVRERWRR